jgi:hypothetical protein
MKQTLILLIAFFLGLGTLSAARGDKSKKVLCGKVVDKTTGEALVGVKVEIKGTGTYCYTDLNGAYSLSVPVDPKLEVEANVVGYEQTKLKTNELGFNIDIPLSPIQ